VFYHYPSLLYHFSLLDLVNYDTCLCLCIHIFMFAKVRVRQPLASPTYLRNEQSRLKYHESESLMKILRERDNDPYRSTRIRVSQKNLSERSRASTRATRAECASIVRALFDVETNKSFKDKSASATTKSACTR